MIAPIQLRASSFFDAIVKTWGHFEKHCAECRDCERTGTIVRSGPVNPSIDFERWHRLCCAEGKALLEGWKVEIDGAMMAHSGLR